LHSATCRWGYPKSSIDGGSEHEAVGVGAVCRPAHSRRKGARASPRVASTHHLPMCCRRPHAESSSGGPLTGCAMAGGGELKAARCLNLGLGASALAWLGNRATKSYCYYSCLLHLLVREGEATSCCHFSCRQRSREVARSCCRWQWLPGSHCSGTRLAQLLHLEK
jgi:hypothetical protein